MIALTAQFLLTNFMNNAVQTPIYFLGVSPAKAVPSALNGVSEQGDCHDETLPRHGDTCSDCRNGSAVRRRAERPMVPGQRSEGLNELRIREPRAMPAVDGRQRRPLRRQSGPPVCSGAFAQTTAAKRLASEFCSARLVSEAGWPIWRSGECSKPAALAPPPT